MIQKYKRIAALLFLVLLGAAAMTPTEEASEITPITSTVKGATNPTLAVSATNVAVPESATHQAITVPDEVNPWHNYANVCETFTVIQSPRAVKRKRGGYSYPLRYKRNRYRRPRSDNDRTKAIVELVAKEMGVKHPKFFVGHATHESSLNPEAIHILNPDLEANSRAWARHSYNRTKELTLESRLAKADARTKEYWSLKAKLADVRLYKGNPHWEDRLAYDFVVPQHKVSSGTVLPEERLAESRNVWAFGYGLYGMYAVGYVKNWDREAPPWILCSHQGVVATIIQVWAARKAQAECDNLTDKNPEKWGHDGGNYRGTLRRLARGKCSDGKLGPKWQGIMRTYEKNGWVSWEKSGDFGTKWPEWKMKKKRGKWVYEKDEEGNRIPADREEVLSYMLQKVEEAGLLRPEPLTRKVPGSEPQILRKGERVTVRVD